MSEPQHRSFFHHLCTLLWKNTIIKRRAPWRTLIEIIAPAIAIALIIVLREALPPNTYPPNSHLADAQTFNAAAVANNLYTFPGGQRGGEVIAFAPNSVGVTDVVAQFVALYPFLNASVRVYESTSAIVSYMASPEYGSGGRNPYISAALCIDTFGTSASTSWAYTIMSNSTSNNADGQHAGLPNTNTALVNTKQWTYNGDWNYYAANGPLFLQDFIETYAIVQALNGYNGQIPVSQWPQRNLTAVPFPTSTYIIDYFSASLAEYLGFMMIIVYIWPITGIIRVLVNEKESRIKECMMMMGLSRIALWLSWFITYTIISFITAAIITAMTANTLFTISNAALIFAFFLLFELTAFQLAFLISTFFTNARVASIIGSLVFIAIFSPFYSVTNKGYSAKVASCLSAPLCFALEAQDIINREGIGNGVTLSTANIQNNGISYTAAMAMMCFDCIFYLVLAIYFDQIIPGEWGTAQPWYFPFQYTYWRPPTITSSSSNSARSLISTSASSSTELTSALLMEEQPHSDNSSHQFQPLTQQQDERIGIRIERISKIFYQNNLFILSQLSSTELNNNNKKMAVNNVSFDLICGEIFVLLGHNGAGKTTLLNMLCGFIPVTSGDAHVFGHSILTDMQSIRQTLGVCPQQNILYPTLTVREHLLLYCSIKGVDDEAVEAAIDEMINGIGLKEKVNAQSSTLSGGQQRKLCLGIALIGSSRVILVDEPTSGMDPNSRRATWDLLMKYKEGRVIIMTTHSMEEADQLADRIGIMVDGALVCCGSPLFLKNRFGVGYTMSIVKGRQCKQKQLHQCIVGHIPSAELLSEVAAEMKYRLPFDVTMHFADLFDEIDTHQAEWDVLNYGISVTTIEEVFLRVGHLSAAELADASASSSAPIRIDNDADDLQLLYTTKHSEPTTWSLIRALVIKRFSYARRNRKSWLMTLILPLATLLLFIGVTSNTNAPNSPAVIINGNDMNKPIITPFATNNSLINISPYIQDKLNNYQLKYISNITKTSDMSYYLYNTYSQQLLSTYGAYMYNINILNNNNNTQILLNDNVNIFFNTSATFSLPLFYSLYNQAILRYIISKNNTNNNNTDIYNNNNTNTYNNNDINDNTNIIMTLKPFPQTANAQLIANAFLTIIINVALSIIPANYIYYIVKEREIHIKHLQFINGITPFIYWISNFIWDLINWILPILSIIFTVFIYDISQLIHGENILALLILLFLYGLAIIPFTYLLSFLFTNHIIAQNTIMTSYRIIGTILLVTSIVLSIIPTTQDIQAKLVFIFRLIPPFTLGDGIANMILRSSVTAHTSIPGLWDMQVVGWDCVYLFFQFIICTVAVIAVEHAVQSPRMRQVFSPVRPQQVQSISADESSVTEDDDVRAERMRLAARDSVSSDDMVDIRGLHKKYETGKVAIKDLFLSVPKGQCLGLLGTNGAGKTSCLKILTGDTYPTSGTAYLDALDVVMQRSQLRNRIGYCPQFDALINTLTAREHLFLFARIKGIDESIIPQYVQAIIDKIGLQKGISDLPSGKYSGGNKRKLCVGIALIGNPPIVFLDEPSTGMDPGGRRQMWDLISQTMKGRSVILTTHSMDECELLCQRIAIMVDGTMTCLGTAQRLKSLYGSGYTLDIHLKSSSEAVSSAQVMSDLIQRLSVEFNGESSVTETRDQSMKYHIPRILHSNNTIITIGKLFRLIENIKLKYFIYEYSISEMTLEQIFLHFARLSPHSIQDNNNNNGHINNGNIQNNNNGSGNQRSSHWTVRLYQWIRDRRQNE